MYSSWERPLEHRPLGLAIPVQLAVAVLQGPAEVGEQRLFVDHVVAPLHQQVVLDRGGAGGVGREPSSSVHAGSSVMA